MLFKDEMIAARDCKDLRTLLEIQQRALGPGEQCWSYLSIYENTPEKLPYLPPKIFCNFA